MKLCRFELEGFPRTGVVLDDTIRELYGSSLLPFLSGAPLQTTGAEFPLHTVELLAPVPDALNLYCSAGNYRDHVKEGKGQLLDKSLTNPRMFLKPVGGIVGPDEPLQIPSISPDAIDWECEVGVIISKVGKHIPVERAADYIGGYTIFNDFSDRNFRPNPQRQDRDWDTFFDWLHGKWHDTFAAMGPVVVTRDELPTDFFDLRLELRVNGETKQDATTEDMIYTPEELIAFLSSFVTLRPGDIIATGTPGGVAAGLKCPFLKPGDIVEAEISSIGILRTPVIAEA